MRILPPLVVALVFLLAGCGHDDETRPAASGIAVSGVYSGVIPCADCPGIRKSLRFRPPDTVEVTRLYLESHDTEDTVTGTYRVVADENMIVVTLPDGEKAFYRIRSAAAIAQLRANGEPVTGPLADAYVLTRQTR